MGKVRYSRVCHPHAELTIPPRRGGSKAYHDARWIGGLEKEMKNIFKKAINNPRPYDYSVPIPTADTVSLLGLDLAGNSFNLRKAITRRTQNHVEVDDGLSRGWSTLPAAPPGVAIDSDGELAYVFLPQAIKVAGLVRYSKSFP